MMRSTRQRDAIWSAIESAKRPLSPREIRAGTQQTMPAVGIATVYRNLKQLLAEGRVKVVPLPGDSPRYEVAETAHHHHFQCTACNRVYDIAACRDDWRRLAPRGFAVEHHELTLYGRCSDCGKRATRASRCG